MGNHKINKYEINTEDTGYGWYATLEGFDGAPDAKGIYSLQGSASTEVGSINALLFQISELVPFTDCYVEA